MQENEVIKIIFAFKVKYHRLQLGLNYKELSEKTGLSLSYLNDIEKGKKYPKFDKINALANAFGVSYDYLVSSKASKKLQPIIDLFSSDFMKVFPTQNFGVDPYALFDMLATTPDKVAAFVSTLFRITRAYQMRSEHFFLTALRSYQDVHDNYFEELEKATTTFRKKLKLGKDAKISVAQLEQILETEFAIKINYKELEQRKSLESVRSYYAVNKKILYINVDLDPRQVKFILGREIAFNYLEFKERPFAFSLIEIDSFEKILNNFKASYFAVSLLMPEKTVANDLFEVAQKSEFDEKAWLGLLEKYEVTAEMFLQRLSNILPKHFNLENLFFLRLKPYNDLQNFEITKELHLSHMHNAYANVANENYCRRWVSINVIKDFAKSGRSIMADCQISKYKGTPNQYLCISFAFPSYKTGIPISVTLGLAVTEQLRQVFRFVNSPNIKQPTVNTTCERCAIEDCEQRVREPIILNEMKTREDILKKLETLSD